jgi:CMP-N-acetylneuraminic acid synthetase
MQALIIGRADSKGLPNKNKILFKYTADQIVKTKDLFSRVTVSTDDKDILLEAEKYGFSLKERDRSYCRDDTPVSDVVRDFTARSPDNLCEDDHWLYVFYPTYPLRSPSIIRGAVQKADTMDPMVNHSLIGMKSIKTHPGMCFSMVSTNSGRERMRHYVTRESYSQYYRRQDLPADVYEICHAVCIISTRLQYEGNMCRQMLGMRSMPYIFSKEEEKLLVDVDTQEDLEKLDSFMFARS